MPLSERFAGDRGTTLGVQAQTLATGDPITTLSVVDVQLLTANVASEINASILIDIDGTFYAVGLTLVDESLETLDHLGRQKTRQLPL